MDPLTLIGPLTLLYNVIQRNIKRRGDIDRQRADVANELTQNCKDWATLLVETFDRAIVTWTEQGREKAIKEIEALQSDFLKLDYNSLHKESPLIAFLREDKRYAEFADRCVQFYGAALDVKKMVGQKIAGSKPLCLPDSEVEPIVQAWQLEVERMLRRVVVEHYRLRTILPK